MATKIFKIQPVVQAQLTDAPLLQMKEDIMSVEERYEYIKAWVQNKPGFEFREKQRHRHLVLMAGECLRWGLPMEYVLAQLLGYQEETFPEKEIRTTTESIYSNYKDDFAKFCWNHL